MIRYDAVISQYNKTSTGIFFSFQGGDIEAQRAYIWTLLSSTHQGICLYIDAEKRFSKHMPPPRYAHVLCISFSDFSTICEVVNEISKHISIDIIIVDPFPDWDKIPLGWMYTRLKNIIRQHNIKVYLLFYPENRPLFHAQVYIDLRRCITQEQ